MPVMVIGELSLPVLISNHEAFIMFCPVEEGSDKAALVGTWCPVRVRPPCKVKFLSASDMRFSACATSSLPKLIDYFDPSKNLAIL